MDGQMDKTQVIEATIGVLSEISVPVRMKEQITTPIEGAIRNLVIVLQMIKAENEMNQKAEAEETAEIEQMEAAEEMETWNGGNVKHYPDADGHPGKEATEPAEEEEDEPRTDAE